MDGNIPRCILLIVLIVAGGIFSGAETAYSYCNRIRIKTLAEEGNARARRAAVIIGDDFDKAITTLLIMINVFHVITSGVATVLAIQWMPWNTSLATLLSTVILTILVFFFSETLPKTFARDHSDGYALAFAPLFYGLMVFLTPVTFLFLKIGSAVKRLFAGKEKEPEYTEDEFADLVEKVGDEGVLNEEESEIIRSAVEFSDTTVRDIFTPAEKVVAVDRNWDREEILDLLKDERFSRVPVYDRDLSHIVGILQTKEYLTAILNAEDPDAVELKDYLRQAYTVKPEMTLTALFEYMGRRHTHIALVVNQRGALQGIVTMEDLLEELVGEIYDEDDVAEDVEENVEENTDAPAESTGSGEEAADHVG